MAIVPSTTDFPARFTTQHLNATTGAYVNMTSPREMADPHWEYVCYMLDSTPEVAWSYKFQMLWSLTAVVVGLVANSLNVVVFSSREMLAMSSNVYLMALAISDSCFLLAFVLAHALTYINCIFVPHLPIDIYNRSDGVCKALQYLLDLFSDYSAMLILAFTVERYIACYHAIRFREWCTVRRARLTCGVMFALIAAVISPYHVICMGLPVANGIRFEVCNVLPDAYEDAFYFAYMVEVLLLRVVPIGVIAVLNVLIIVKVTKLHRAKKKRRKATAKRATTGSGGNSANTSTSVRATSRDDRHLQLTMMLILVSSTYILLYIPVLVCFFLNRMSRVGAITMDDVTLLLLKNYTVALDISGFAINFFLYTMSGKIFRDKLRRISSCKQEPVTMVTTLNGGGGGGGAGEGEGQTHHKVTTAATKMTALDGTTRGHYEACATNGDNNVVAMDAVAKHEAHDNEAATDI